MRTPRIKASTLDRDTFYHCMSRTVNGAHLFDKHSQAVFRKQLYLTADFCGVQVLTYTILSNHFHVLVRIPKSAPISDAELLRRYRLLHPAPTRYQLARLDVIQAWLSTQSPEGIAWRSSQLALMGDVSRFLQLLKQRFSIWFNRNHNRFGTLWAERFKSLLLEPSDRLLLTVAAYIDLNSVRAGLVTDPGTYPFCGYADALAHHPHAQAALTALLLGPALHETDRPLPSWAALLQNYRSLLFSVGAGPRPGDGTIPSSIAAQVLSNQPPPSTSASAPNSRHTAFSSPSFPTPSSGSPPPAASASSSSLPLLHSIREFTNGGALGTPHFVALLQARLKSCQKRRHPPKPKLLPLPLPTLQNQPLPPLATLHPLRRIRSSPTST